MQQQEKIVDTSIEKAAFILKGIAHPVRLRILRLLGEYDALSVSEICREVDCEQSSTSHHLSNMRTKGLISATRKGKQIYYELRHKDILKIFDCLEDCDCSAF